MKKYSYILFDLDGTITDSGLGITNSVMFALAKLGIQETDCEKLYKFIGPPLADSFKRYYGLTEEEARDGIKYYRQYYRAKGIYENRVYDRIPNLLENLKLYGKKVILATSKPELFAREILDYFKLSDYFDLIAGASMDEKGRIKKEEVIAYALEELKIYDNDKQKALMIGDREHDIIGARKNGLDSMGVLFGFGTRTELTDAGADYIVSDVGEIIKYLCASSKPEK